MVFRVLICIFLMIDGVEHLFMYLLRPSVCCLWKDVYSDPPPIFKYDCFDFIIELYEFFIYFVYYPLLHT